MGFCHFVGCGPRKSKDKYIIVKEVERMCQLVNIETNFGTEIPVADIKAEYITNVLEKAGICRNIFRIFLFGSALEERCREESDIDLLVISNISRPKLYVTESFHWFLAAIYDMDGGTQKYDMICTYGLDELERDRRRICSYRRILFEGKEIYRRLDDKS